MQRMILLVCMTVALTTTATSAGRDVSFWAVRDYAVELTTDVAVADFNGDGRPDVVITHPFADAVTVFLSGGGAVRFDCGPHPQGIAIGDLNGDSRIDLAVSISDNVAVLLGKGDGSFQPARYFPAAHNPGWIAVADFNGDRAPDVVVSGGAMVLLGNGDGTFRPAASVGLADSVLGQAVGDFNEDGHVDIAAEVFDSSIGTVVGITVLKGTGDGTFVPSPYTTLPTGGTSVGVIAGDFNGDGTLDVAASLWTPDVNLCNVCVGVFIGNGDGTFRPPIFNSSSDAEALAVGDFNNDSKLDVAATTTVGEGQVQVLTGVGDGRLNAPVNLAASGQSIAVADLNGDSNADLVISGGGVYNGVGTLSFRFGKGDGSFAETPGLRTGMMTTAIEPADFNGDGRIDLAAAVSRNPGDDTSYLALILGNGNGTFKPSPAVLRTSFRVHTVTSGDFDGDSRVDIVAAGSGAGTSGVYLLRGHGDGSLAEPQLIQPTSGDAMVLTRDLNSDEILDLVVVDATRVAVLIGNGNGAFQVPINVVAGVAPLDAAVGDFNADGVPDLAITNQSPYRVSVTLGNGDGTFGPAVDTAVADLPYSLAAADFNRDGSMDLAVSLQGSADITVLLGVGDGTFAPPVTYHSAYQPGANPPGFLVRAADLNGDGNLDLAVLAHLSISILIGNGDGTFRLQVTGFSTLLGATGMALADLTSDGRVDVAVGGDGRPESGAVGIVLLYNTPR